MTRALIRRVEKLEQTMVTTAEARTGKGHWLISEKGEDRKAKEAALRASAAWTDGDWITHWVVVDPLPPPRLAEPPRTAGAASA